MSLQTLFRGIANAIREKDGTTETISASAFPERIRNIPTGAASGEPLDPVEVYNATRPADWLTMPVPDNNEMYLLFHIPDGVSSLLAFTVTCNGSYTVALGTVENGQFVQQSAVSVTSASKYEAEIFAEDYGGLTSDGFKQVMVKISGTDVLTWEPATHSKKTAPDNFSSWNIVEIACKLPSGTKVACGNSGGNRAVKKLRYFSWYGTNAATSMVSMFNGCYDLTAILHLDTSSVVTMNSTFNNCSNLTAIPQLNTSNVTNMANMFNNCSSLSAIPQLDTSRVTSMSNMFSYCYSLTAIPQLNTSNVTNMSSMFYICRNLTTVPQLDTSSVINMSGMFNNCSSLTTIPQLDTSKVTNMSNMFNYCYILSAIQQLDTSSVTSMSGMFNGCYSLTKLTFNSQVTGWDGFAISLSQCSLGRQSLIGLFNSLPVIAKANNLTLTGNPGASELTDTEKAIATGKNWTLIL